MVQRLTVKQNYERLNAGIIAAAVLNSAPFGNPDRKPASPLDFVPEWKEPEQDLSTMTPEEQRSYFTNLFAKRMEKKE